MTLNPWLLLGLGIAWLVSLVGVGRWQNDAGHTAERVTWQAREIKQNNDYAAAVKLASDDARATEYRLAQGLATAARNYERSLANVQTQKDRDVAAARAGDLVLRFRTTGNPAGRSEACAASPTPGIGDGGATSELPREVAADLLALANDADQIATQLGACQAVIRADRAPNTPPR